MVVVKDLPRGSASGAENHPHAPTTPKRVYVFESSVLGADKTGRLAWFLGAGANARIGRRDRWKETGEGHVSLPFAPGSEDR